MKRLTYTQDDKIRLNTVAIVLNEKRSSRIQKKLERAFWHSVENLTFECRDNVVTFINLSIKKNRR